MKRKGTSINPKPSYWLIYLLPALLVYLIFMAYPLADSIRLSLYSGSSAARVFVGFENFAQLFGGTEHSVRFWNAFGNTCVFFLIHMLVQNGLGILFAALLTHSSMRGQKLYQTIIFIPTTFAVLVTGYLWKLLLNPVWSKGLLAGVGLQSLAQPWLGLENTALTAVALVSCWQWIGIPTMMFVAAMNNISEDLYEAASIEGATDWQVFTRIKLPLMMPVVGMVSILTFVNNFNAFDIVFSMETANGAPGYATDLIGTLFYRVGIAGQHPVGIPNPGLGAAIASVIFVFLAAASFIILRKTRTEG